MIDVSIEDKVRIVEHHNDVLPYWAEFRRGTESPPFLITFDHHTDTSPAFRRYLSPLKPGSQDFEDRQSKLIQEIDFQNDDSILHTTKLLNNDEHVIAAIKSGILSHAFVIAQNAMNTDIDCFLKHRIACFEVAEKNWNHVLESEFVNEALSHFDQTLNGPTTQNVLSKSQTLSLEDTSNFILDIDLDYFKSFASVEPKCSESFRNLVKRAGLITIATEPDFVKSGALDKDLTSEHLLERILHLIKSTPSG